MARRLFLVPSLLLSLNLTSMLPSLSRGFGPTITRLPRFFLSTRAMSLQPKDVGDTTTLPDFGSPSFGMTKTLPGVSYDEAITKITAALKNHGFGVLTTIDMVSTMKNKLKTEFTRPYVILGACNPGFAHRALTHTPAIGLLLPCNIVVTTNEDNDALISMLDPIAMFTSIMNEPGMEDMAKEVKGLLQGALDEL